ncbi:YceI family protein [Cellulosimicrobium marinum]|uniref:YceI family protein n=1 Tax=Cellulosimicrobium marinum TaxID=1638992 RepID=UPI001E5B0EF3|nr:YceI family protein [Cellulosimicrobium marinum]MCB7135384.1 YceI family protein [Cellulosimicrobium marinum]
MSRSARWIVVSVALALVVVLLAPFVYSELTEGRTPPPLGLQTPGEPSLDVDPPAPGAFDADGRWAVNPGSAAGFRAELLDVPEGDAEVVGTTDDVTGSVEVRDGEVVRATVENRTATLTTGDAEQDRLVRQVLEVDLNPTATFALTSPLDVSALEETTDAVHLEASGTLTLRGETQPVTAALEAQRSGEGVVVAGAISVRFSDFGLTLAPSSPVQVDDQGTVEMRLVLARSGA